LKFGNHVILQNKHPPNVKPQDFGFRVSGFGFRVRFAPMLSIEPLHRALFRTRRGPVAARRFWQVDSDDTVGSTTARGQFETIKKQLDDTNDQLQRLIASSTKQSNDRAGKLKERLVYCNGKRVDLLEELKKCESSFASVEEAAGKAKTDFDNKMSAQAEAHNQQVADLQTAHDDATKAAAEDVAAVTKELDQSKEELGKALEESDAAESSFAELTDTCNNNSKLFTESSRRLQTLGQNVIKLQEEKQGLQADLDLAITDHEENIAAKEAQHAQSMQECQDEQANTSKVAKEAKEACDGKVAELEERVQELQNVLDDQRKKEKNDTASVADISAKSQAVLQQLEDWKLPEYDDTTEDFGDSDGLSASEGDSDV
jgi:chromosome segregation ATPase